MYKTAVYTHVDGESHLKLQKNQSITFIFAILLHFCSFYPKTAFFDCVHEPFILSGLQWLQK